MMRSALLGLTLLLVLTGCGMGSHFSADPSEFRYQPPETVSDADKAECTSRARSAAQQRGWELSSSKGLERTAMWGGVIGAVGAFSYLYQEEEDTYEEEFKTCLEEKGHDLD